VGGPGRAPQELSGFGFADLVPVPVAVDAGKQAGPAAVMPEVPGLVTLAVKRAGGGDHLGRIPRDEHVAAAAGRRALHRDLSQLFVFHGSRSAIWSARRVMRRTIGVT